MPETRSERSVSPQGLPALSPGSPSAPLASYLAVAMAVASQATTLYLVASTWRDTSHLWTESGRWAPHAANAGILLALSFPPVLVLALRLGARVIERRSPGTP